MPIYNVWDESLGHRQIKLDLSKVPQENWRRMNFNVYENYPKLYSALIIAVLVYPRFFFFFCYVKIFVSVYLPQQTNAYFKKRRFPLELKRPQITWGSFFITPVGRKPIGYEQSTTSDSNLAPRKRLARVRPHCDSRAKNHFSPLCHCKKN